MRNAAVRERGRRRQEDQCRRQEENRSHAKHSSLATDPFVRDGFRILTFD
jgi:hypothetical protein